MLKGRLVFLTAFALSACSSSEEEIQEQEEAQYASYDSAAVEEVYESGDYQKAIDILRAKNDAGNAKVADHLLAAEIHNFLLDGISAEVALEKAKEAGAPDEEIGVARVRSLFAQGKSSEAKELIDTLEIDEEAPFDFILLQGDIAQTLGNNEEAKALYEQAVNMEPDNYAGYLALANLQLSNGNFEEAGRLSTKAAEYVTQDPILDYVRGVAAKYTDDMEVAASFLEQSIQGAPDNLPAHLELADILIEQGQLERAKTHLDTVYSQIPGHPRAFLSSASILAIEGNFVEAEALALRAEDLLRTYPPAMRIYGNITHRLGKCNVATGYLTQFLALLPEDRMTRVALADCLNQTGRADAALNTLTSLLGTESNDVEAHILATTIAPNLADPGASMEVLSNALKVIPENGDDNAELTHKIRQQLAVALAVSGDAKAAAQQLLKTDSNSKHVLDNLIVLANIKIGQNDLVGANNVAEQIVKIWPKTPEGPNLMGAIQYRSRNIEKALEHYNQAILIDSNYESARKNRALALLEAGRFSDAEQDLILLAETAPNDGEIRGMLGRTWLNSNQP
ncbi:MAG: tetratricopeptide repeat protein [Kordiimonas sp.]